MPEVQDPRNLGVIDIRALPTCPQERYVGATLVRLDAMEVIAGRYELHRRIGEGGMGAVWLAFDRKTDAFVAVKMLAQHESAGLLRFVREQSLRIDHPHVVTPRGWAADDDQVALSMDLVRGGSLTTLVGDHGALPEPYVAVVIDQLLDALATVHARGVLHRDVNPSNVLLEPTGEATPFARLSDFGVAAVLDGPRLTEHGSGVGTPGYLSPEQAAHEDLDPRSDLYSLGILGRHLLTGLPPDRLADGASEGQLWEVLSRLSDHDIHARPASAALAREQVRPLLPDGMPWASDPDGPFVFEHIELPGRPAPATGTTPVKVALPASRAARPAAVPAPSTAARDAGRPPEPRHTVEEPRRGLSRNALRAIAIGSFTVATVFVVVVALLLI